MKKRGLSFFVTAALVCSLLPATALADGTSGANFSDQNVTWLGNQADYQKTLDGFFQSGMRKVKVGDKWGLVDATGEFVAPPIYDKMQPYFNYVRGERERLEYRQTIFVGGYTQVERGGKMGLLNAYGEEVIPTQYDAVGLPVEGISRVYSKSGSTYYLGYWSLEQGREIVPPNKYKMEEGISTAIGAGRVDTTRSYELTAAELAGRTEATTETAPVGNPAMANKLKLTKFPHNEYFMAGDHTFDTEGMVVIYYDKDGVANNVPISDVKITVDGNEIRDGYVFKSSSIKNAKIHYMGLTYDFRILVFK